MTTNTPFPVCPHCGPKYVNRHMPDAAAFGFMQEQLQRFAELVRAEALEDAAKASETQWITSSEKMYGVEFAAYLRSMK